MPRKPWAFLLLVHLLLAASWLGATSAATESPAETARRLLAADPATARLELVDARLRELARTGVTLLVFKALDPRTGEAVAGAFDLDGRPAALEALRCAERQAGSRLAPELAALLAVTSADAEIPVAIWLRAEGFAPPARPAPARSASVPPPAAPDPGPLAEKPPALVAAQERAWREAIRTAQEPARAAGEVVRQLAAAELERQMAELETPLLDALAALGRGPDYTSPLAPLVHARLRPAEIALLAARDDVDTIYPPYRNYDLLDVAKPTQKATVVENNFGFTGDGVQVAILEDSRIEFLNPYLVDGITRVPGHANVDQHATACAGMVASQHTTYEGLSVDAGLLSANATDYTDANLSAAMDWASAGTPGGTVDVINNSWGGNAGTTTLNVHDRHLDWIVRHLWQTVPVAAGNETAPCGSTGRVTSPARAFNVVAVGGFDDAGTLTWDDDAMYDCSSYVDPSSTHGDREEPDLVASGDTITSTTHASPWTGNVGSGTSYAAPMVSAAAALMLERDATLEDWPEIVRALLQAAAVHNIEGSARLSEMDGAGGLDARAAFHAADEHWWGGWGTTSSSFPVDVGWQLAAGRRTRVAIAWDSNPAGDYATDPLEADLDLWVLDPGGIAVAGSTSWDNSYEIVDFTPTTTGTYTFRITAPTYSGAAEYVGLAWWLDHLPLASHAPVTADVPPVSRDYYRFNPVGSAWNVLALRSPAGADYDLWLVEGNAFGDPDDHQMAAWSTDTARVDFVAVDNHHEPASTHYAETSAWVGTGAYAIEFASPTASIAATGGSFGGTFWDDEVVYIYDSSHQPGVRKYYRVAPTGGSPDFGLALLESHPGDPGTYHQGRASAVAVADVQGAGIWEALNWQSTADDSYALVIFRNDAVGTGGYSLYADTTAPTGAVMINDGAFSTPTSNVTLSLPAADAQTGLWRMAVHNAGTSWPVDIDYVPTIPFSLLPGEGWRTVEVNYVNRAFMRSVTYTDTIFVHPLLLMFDGFESGSTSAWRWRWP